MKSLPRTVQQVTLPSLSARRVWIEITTMQSQYPIRPGHSPRGGCGLKSEFVYHETIHMASLSARRVWIEIELDIDYVPGIARHSPRGGCGLKLQ